MKTSHSNPEYIKRVAAMQMQAMQVNPPAIPFRRRRKKDEDDEVRDEEAQDQDRIPPDEDSDEIEIRATVFDEGERGGLDSLEDPAWMNSYVICN
jgi:hypothetical protein